MLTLDKLNEREAKIKGFLQQTLTRAEQMRGALECLAILKKDCEAAAAEVEREATAMDGATELDRDIKAEVERPFEGYQHSDPITKHPDIARAVSEVGVISHKARRRMGNHA